MLMNKVLNLYKYFQQCCGVETICFGSRSGSDYQKISALAPELAPAPSIALELPVSIAFILKMGFSCFLGKNIDLIHLLDPI
jgi:hypothetical protein